MWAVGFQAFKHFLLWAVVSRLLNTFCVLYVGCWFPGFFIICGLLVSRLSVCYMWAVGFQAFKHFLCIICGLLVSRLLNTFCVLCVGCWFPGF